MLNIELLHLLWVVAVFVANMQRERNKELSNENKELKGRLNKVEAALSKCVDDQHVRSLIDKSNEPMRSDLKEVAATINTSMREFDEKFHGLALDIARGSRGASHND
jgi:light-regulated signal transduction histidine kinase (bacteriophytochrome)